MSLTKVSYSMIQGAAINVLDFGADPTGVADSTAAVQAAVNAGSAVFLPEGTYKFTNEVTLPSDVMVFGTGAGTVIQLTGDLIKAFTTGLGVSAKENISISNMLIDGGGQTTDIYTGYKGNLGIYATRVVNLKIDNLIIRNMGVIKAGDPLDDNAYGGIGIQVSARFGDINNIRISNCTVYNMAGGGSNKGDGITIDGYATGTTSDVDTVISNCWVSTVGRHCFTIAGGVGATTPVGVKLINCYAEKAASDGVDIEEGNNVLIEGCTFESCGNDQTYYNPVAIYGPTYRLLAGVSTGGASFNTTISNCTFNECYYAINFGNTTGLIITNCTTQASAKSDLYQGLASGAFYMKIANCNFGTAVDTLGFSTPNNVNCFFECTASLFRGPVIVNAMQNGSFTNCTFEQGFKVIGGDADFNSNTIKNCLFTNFTGAAIECVGTNYAHSDCLIDSCTFLGAGSLTHGVYFGTNSANAWQITNNQFVGLTNAGVGNVAGTSPGAPCALISNNVFRNCVSGINFTSTFIRCVISNNTFFNTSSWAIDIDSGSDNLLYVTVNANSALASVSGNGFKIKSTLGTFDYCIITSNNVHDVGGTKWTIGAGNANGIVANNITT